MQFLQYAMSGREANKRTVLIRANIFPRDGILLIHLCHEVFLSFLQHVELRSEAEDGIFGAVLLLLRCCTPKPTPDTGHFDVGGK
jgi:hypothetical protein